MHITLFDKRLIDSAKSNDFQQKKPKREQGDKSRTRANQERERRSNHWRCFIKTCSYKHLKIHWKTPLESLFLI